VDGRTGGGSITIEKVTDEIWGWEDRASETRGRESEDGIEKVEGGRGRWITGSWNAEGDGKCLRQLDAAHRTLAGSVGRSRGVEYDIDAIS
jgi:hypothetical protein